MRAPNFTTDDVWDEIADQKRRADEDRRRREARRAAKLASGYTVCTRCNGHGILTKDEGRQLYPRTDIKQKIDRTCPECLHGYVAIQAGEKGDGDA